MLLLPGYPERLVGGDPDDWIDWLPGSSATKPDIIPPDVVAEYQRCFRGPAAIHARCENYRAGATIDLRHDGGDGDVRIGCPVPALWGRDERVARRYDLFEIWRQKAIDLTGFAVPGGHFVAEGTPAETLAALLDFLEGCEWTKNHLRC